ncbi:hypothetical protein FQN54_005924 [Arachnomyces sp. PD_36]|nr:hypothetical protein FQN54_005924 [Arachnomyces sp. PD_36]
MAGPSTFFDPFFRIQETANLLSAVHLSDEKNPPQLVSEDGDHDLPIQGQGTISLSSNAKKLLRFELRTSDGKNSLYLEIGDRECHLYGAEQSSEDPLKYQAPKNPKRIPFEYLKKPADAGLRSGVKSTYWLSIDRNNGIIMYGKYYANRSMALIQTELKKTTKEGVKVWVDDSYAWLETLKEVYAIQDPLDDNKVLPQMKIHPLPVVIDLSPFIISDQKISLLQLEKCDYTIFANLPTACQNLYQNVAGPNITLDTEDFPFAAAIQRSVSTKGLWGYEKLMEKADEFGKHDEKGTYLRITIGTNQGNSPGIPYVLEIWPGGHYSPVHDHGNACAVIKVLHGMINATYYDSLTSPGGPYEINTAELREGIVTWIGPNNYQIHKLHNDTETVCCTIQCYRFPDEDKEHYEKFNYVDGQGAEQAFNPNSDMAFKDFQDLMRKEWNDWKTSLKK